MAVFDSNVKVARAVKDPGTDKCLPAPGSLSYGAIASTGALAGCPGTDAQLIHGDKWIKIDAKQTELITGDVLQKLSANQTIFVGANQTETIGGTSNETIIGPHIISNMNVYNETRIGAHIQVHGGLEWVHDKESEWHYGGLQFSVFANTVEFEIDHYEAALGHLEFKGQHNYFSVNENSASLFVFQAKALNAEADAADAIIAGLEGDVRAMQGKLGALEAKAVAAIPTAGADVNPTPLI